MLRLKLILILLFIFVVVKNASAETIVVTSNADTGPNTLRTALQRTLDNDTTEIDYIHFNLPNDQTTIRVRTQLPKITSHVIIDGSTQPGSNMGVSGAKVIIEPEFQSPGFAGLVIGPTHLNTSTGIYGYTNNVEIYGLYIRNFGSITNIFNPGQPQSSGIIIDYRANNIRIGKPGKGNVICGNYAGIYMRNSSLFSTPSSLSKIYIQSNFIGVRDDGAAELINYTGIHLDVSEYNVLIGGDNPGEGNVISANLTGINAIRQYSNSLKSSLNIVGNKIGTDLNGTRDYNEIPVFLPSTADMNGVKVAAANTDLVLVKNIISGQRKWGVSITNSDFLITGNKIGTGAQGTENLGNDGGIRIEPGSARGTIGGPAIEDINYIGNNKYGIETASSGSVVITQNSIFCNETYGIGKALSSAVTQAYVQVLKIRPDYISGKASPNAQVELFYTDNCAGSCQGKTYFASQRAGNDGRWEYNGTLTGNVTATATLPNAVTSQFSTVGLLDNEAIIDPVTCKGNGKITVTEPREGITFKWYKLEANSSSFLSNDTFISNLTVGTYQLLMSDGCKEISHQFAITDQILTPPTVYWPSPACGQTSFQFRAETLRGKGTIIFEWLDENGNVKAWGSTVQMPEGKYRLRIRDEVGCFEYSAFQQISKRPTPVINANMRQIKPAACGLINGAITGITVTPGVGNVSYKWYQWNNTNQTRGAEISQTLDLQGVDGGYYQLEVTDQSSCSPVFSAPLFINTIQSVFFSGGTANPTTCNSPNGSITNVSITHANEYEWLTFAGISIEKNSYSPGMVLELKNLAPGTYKLRAKNTTTGCKDSTNFIIYQQNPIVYQYSISTIPTTCGFFNGSIQLNYPSPLRPARIEWRDASGNIVPGGTSTTLSNLAPGEYRYYTYDPNNCMNISDAIIIQETPLLKIKPATARVTPDGCGLKTGSVMEIEVIGGVPPYKFKWLDQNDKEVGYAQNLTDISLGNYKLLVTDQTNCGTDVSEVYSVADPDFVVDPPESSDLRVCYKTQIMLPIKNPLKGTYQLLKEPDPDGVPIQESTKGIFTFEVGKTDYYFIRLRQGRCYSEFTRVRIEVINDNLKIMNAMTPNADGKNDDWIITGLPENNNEMTIHVYNRDGQLMYESVGAYDRPFNGTFIGNPLPKGVYYYKVDLKSGCKPLVGSITLLR